ncbi:hypothetical protein QFC19_004767 [Naganishia cerealis]|uniref:Uncharacterized protein n=1 Tax=Naganishia cerealis TaxID=610337 RepID=A0ACC2VTZ0_9TREE|nr:hypothetical protein QFC19_004767 [Naganishia cerealis]
MIKPLLCESKLFHDPAITNPDAVRAEIKRLMKHRGGLKIGQGGTLDPLADGVLVIGVNKGTKQLSQFLHCTKSYTTTALLGSCTTTYDSEGPILSTAPWAHVTREVIEQALEKFRGEIMQVPPIFSALKMDGKPLYEYARSNTPLPRPIDARRANISLLQLESFTPASVVQGDGGHTFHPPKEQLSEAEQEVYFRMQRLTREAGVVEKQFGQDDDVGKKGKGKSKGDAEKAGPVVHHLDIPDLPHPSTTSELPTSPGGPTPSSATTADTLNPPAAHIRPPTFTLRMTVSSGTYVRSIVHDLALSIGSAAHVVTLTRTRQGRFSLSRDPEGGEELAATAAADEGEKATTDGGNAAASGEWYVHDPDGPDRFDFGERKTGCIPWSVFESAIAERNAARKLTRATEEAEGHGKTAPPATATTTTTVTDGAPDALEEGEANASSAPPTTTARWQPKEWEKEFYARFVPV